MEEAELSIYAGAQVCKLGASCFCLFRLHEVAV